MLKYYIHFLRFERTVTMKKFITIILLSAMCFTLFSCNDSENDDGSVRVQQITYTTSEDTVTLTSSFYFDYTTEEVDVSEYENAAKKLGYDRCYTTGIIEVNGTAKNTSNNAFNDGHTPEQLSDFIGTSFYSWDYDYNNYQKIYLKHTYTAVHISYLNVTFVNDDTFEVSYYDNSLKGTKTLRIKTDNYNMVYFSEQ